MNIFEKKIKAINELKFLKTLKKLKTILKFFDYDRKFVTWYVFLTKKFWNWKF